MFDESETEKTTTDTISVLGDFKIAAESDLGLIVSLIIQDGANATPLIGPLPKEQFEALYPDINVTADRGYPKHFSIFGGNIHIGPIPDSVSYTYRTSYSMKASTITSATSSVPFTGTYRDVLADNVLSRLWKLLGEPEQAAASRQDFETGFFLACRRERHNSGAGTFVMKPTDC
jgi:hypothetical protein